MTQKLTLSDIFRLIRNIREFYRFHDAEVNTFGYFDSSEISESVNFCVMEAIKLCRLDTPIIFIEARINLSRFVVTGCAAKTSATVTFPSLNLISLFAFCFNIWLNGVRSEERFSRNAETDLVCRLLLEKQNSNRAPVPARSHQ